MSNFTDRMECKAKDIADTMKHMKNGWKPKVNCRTNVKPWYSSLSMFKPGVDIVLIGANPAGNPDVPPPDSDVDAYEKNLNSHGFNAYLDESWKGLQAGKETLQRGVRTVFAALTLHGDETAGDALLRNSACFNVCPLRTENINQIPKAVWRLSEEWCMEVLRYLNPGLIICNGISKQSALSTVNGPDQNVELIHLEPLGSGCVRYGLIGGAGPLAGCGILGIHHLSMAAYWKDLPRAISNISKVRQNPSLGGRWRTRTSDLVDVNDAL